LKTKTKTTTRITEITVERHEFHVIKRVGHRKVTWCAGCGREVETMMPEEAVALASVAVENIPFVCPACAGDRVYDEPFSRVD